MRAALILFGSAAFLLGLFFLANARSAVHEILAAIAFLAFAVFAAADAVVLAINRAAKKQEALLEEIARNTRPAGSESKPASAASYRVPGIND